MESEEQPAWELEIDGRMIALSRQPIVVGRDPLCDVHLEQERVSWRHLRIELVEDEPLLTDLGSTNGTLLDGRRIDGEPIAVSGDAETQVGGVRGRLREGSTQRSASSGRFGTRRLDELGRRRAARLPAPKDAGRL